MNRIDKTFQKLKNEKKSAMIAYITAGYPTPNLSQKIIFALESAQIDILELGIPFSDPVADGPIIQAASSCALSSGTSVQIVIEMIKNVRQISQLPIVCFTYLNPIYTYGFHLFQKEVVAAGADGILFLDLPLEESLNHSSWKIVPELKTIRLIAPNTPVERMKKIAQLGDGFLYYVSREGVTGEQKNLSHNILTNVREIKNYANDIPVVVGFGISNPEQAKEVSRCADGVVVGSAIVRKISEYKTLDNLAEKVREFTFPISDAVHSYKTLI